MGLLQRRIITYICLSLALALAVPLVMGPDQRHEQQTKTVVFLCALALTPRALAPACAGGPHPLSDHELKKKYPMVRKAMGAILNRGPEWGAASIAGVQPAALVRALAGPKAKQVCLTRLGRVYRLQLNAWGGGARIWAVGTAPGATPQAPRITREQLARYPELARYLQSLAPLPAEDRLQRMRRQAARLASREQGLSSPSRFYRPTAVSLPVRQWRALLAQLDLDAKWPAFRWRDFLIAGREGAGARLVAAPIPGLFHVKTAAAALLLLIGVWLARGVYRRGPGIAINPVWAGVFADLVFILALGFAALGLVDYFQVNWLGAMPLMDEALRAATSLMYLPCLLLMAWFAGNLAGQSLEITPAGLVRRGPGGEEKMSWDDILGFELKDSNLLTARGDMVLPRRLQTLLVIKTKQGEAAVFEPGRRSTKKKIIAALGETAPKRLRADIQRAAEQW